MRVIPKHFDILGQRITVEHEATHAMLDILGYGSWSENEVVVEQLGQCIYQILKTKR